MEMVIECFRALEGDRHIGYGALGPIPFTAIDAWSRRHRIEGRLFNVLVAVIQRLDGERMEREASERTLKHGG